MSDKQYLQGWNKQTPAFTTQTAEGRHPSQKVLEWGSGLRGNTLYAELDLVEATGGQFRAHREKWNPEFRKKDKKAVVKQTVGMHHHEYNLQFCYMLKGWTKLVIDGVEGTFTFREGDSFFLPYRILHNETGASDDVEILSIQAPANVATKQLEDSVGHGARVNDMTQTADMVVFELRHLIVDGAQQFLADNV